MTIKQEISDINLDATGKANLELNQNCEDPLAIVASPLDITSDINITLEPRVMLQRWEDCDMIGMTATKEKVQNSSTDTCLLPIEQDNLLLDANSSNRSEVRLQCTNLEQTDLCKSHLKVQLKELRGKRIYTCKDGGISLSSKSNLEKHNHRSTSMIPYQYGECGMKFSKPSSLVEHTRKNTRSKPYHCDKEFVQKHNLVQTHIHNGSKPYQCGECEKAFSKKSNLVVHTRIHTGSKPYQCGECGKEFRRKQNLEGHTRIHTGSKPYQCGKCEKAFSKKSDLVVHTRNHTGSKPYQCGECGKTISQKQNLVVHTHIHTGSKPYQCGKAFSWKQNLIVHIRIHTGNKPYQFGECGKAFSHKSPVVVHACIHNGSKPYQCGECGKAFK